MQEMMEPRRLQVIIRGSSSSKLLLRNTSYNILLLLSLCFVLSSSSSIIPFPPKEEVAALREIADQLHKRDWDFSLNPCDDNNTNWVNPTGSEYSKYYNNSVYCNCTAAECHVTHIILKGQDLSGVLPPSLAKLPHIIHFDVGANYLSGTIPIEWASTKLEKMALGLNRLSGPIPDFLGNITTLTFLSLEINMFSGQVPASLEKLVNMENLVLKANNLSGEFPKGLSRLTKLTNFRLTGNNFVGKLPDFSGWLNLEKVDIQGCGFEGPIPSSLSLLNNLTELRIGDLNGESSEFPQIGNMTKMVKLMLRNCNISARIPNDILKLTALEVLDLSYNKLHGEPPKFDIGRLPKLANLYLTNNLLSGSIPSWAENPSEGMSVDLSYNNFSESNFSSSCRDNVNLFRSTSGVNTLAPSKCLHNCTDNKNGFHINCAGPEVRVDGHTYEADEASVGYAKFAHSKENWGSSSSGHFWDIEKTVSLATAKNISVLQADHPELYIAARRSPLSLTYYGRCLVNGNYTVELHFAEITFTNDHSYKSLGIRIFDIYIQDELVRKDFNIADQAGGANKAVTEVFKAFVNNSILEIRFTWAGKGTTAIPERGNYGPLVSAISVESDSAPEPSPQSYSAPGPQSHRRKILIIASVVLLCLAGVCILMYRLRMTGYFGGRRSMLQEWKDLDLPIGFFSINQIKAATRDFHPENKIGQGGFGAVYKGTLLDGTIIAVKQLSSVSKQGAREFVTEVGMISGLQHPNLVKLYGCCVEGRQLILVYEYLENNCLGRALFGEEQFQLKLDWPTRQRICLGIAKGLAFLHEESVIKVVHRDIKATNILLDGQLNPKISDFGLAKLDEDENSHISTRVAGTIGYMAPEYALWGHLTFKADVYSFGIVALEIVAGMSNMNYKSAESFVCLIDKALVLQQANEILELVDPKLGSNNYNVEEATRIIKVALLCTNPSPSLRPTMSSVVSMFEGKISIQENVSQSVYDDPLYKSVREKHARLLANNYNKMTPSIVHPSLSSNFPSDGSSASGKDLSSISHSFQ